MTTTAHRLWRASGPLMLASGSAARRILLEGAGIPLLVRPAEVDERAIENPLADAGRDAAEIALALARAKALAVGVGLPGALVLGGDQTLSLDGEPLHKPSTIEAAAAQIAKLSGRAHALNSAVVLARDGVVLFETVVSARLVMRPLSAEFIATYVAAAGPGVCDSVGGYKLEGLGIHLFERIEGDQSTIMGLPLMPVLAALRGLGVLAG